MTKPSEVMVTSDAKLNVEEANHNLVKHITPSTSNVAKKKKVNAPVRNAAFREHEGLRALQRELNSTRHPRPRNTKKGNEKRK